MKRYPVIGIPCDVTRFGLNAFHGVGEKYINAVVHGADVYPLLIPAQGPSEDLQPLDKELFDQRLLDNIDGLFLSGSPTNIQPDIYSDESSLTPDSHDPQRDSLTLSLILAAIKRKLPILAVCRGMQELNVALGGTLHQRVHEIDSMMDHQEDKTLPREGQYGDAHPVQLAADGLLAQLVGTHTVKVNSLHGQGINQLGQGLIAEAHAPDGLVEAVRLNGNDHFVVGVQWHPEWHFQENALSKALFSAFGKAVRESIN